MLVILVICSLLLLLSFTIKKFARDKEYEKKSKPFERLIQNDTTTGRNQKHKNDTEKHTHSKQKETTTHKEILTTDSTDEEDEAISKSEEEESSNESLSSVEKMGSEEPETTPNIYSTIRTSSVKTISVSATTTPDYNSGETETQPIKTTTENNNSSEEENTTEKKTKHKIIKTGETTEISTTEEGESTSYTEISTTDTTVADEISSTKSEEEATTSNTQSETTSVLTSAGETSTYQEISTTDSTDEEEKYSTKSEEKPTTSSIQFETTTLLTTTEEITSSGNEMESEENKTTEDDYSSDTTTTFMETTTEIYDTETITERSSSDEIQYEALKMATTTEYSSEEDFQTNAPNSTVRPVTEETTHVSGTTEEDAKSSTTDQTEVSNSNSTRICRSTGCNLSVGRIITSMNMNEDRRCEEIFNFACGGISRIKNDKNTEIIESRVQVSSEPQHFLEYYSNFFRSCLNYDDVFRYRDRIAKLYEVLTEEVYGHMDFDITDLLANLVLLQAFPHLDIGIDVNPTNLSTFIITLRKPEYKPLDSTVWSSFSEYQRKCIRKTDQTFVSDGLQLHKKYRDCMSNYSDYLSTMQSLKQDMEMFSNKTSRIVEMEKSLGNLSDSLEQFCKAFFNNYESQEQLSNPFSSVMTIKKLQVDFPALNWTRFFSLITDGENIRVDTQILITHMKYFQELMKNLSPKNRSMMNLLKSMAEYIIYENIVSQLHVESRTEFCEQQTNYLMPDIANYLYKIILNSNLTENKIYIKELFNHLKEQFNESLKKSEWIDDISRFKMQQKLEKIQLVLFNNEDFENERNILNARYNRSMNKDDYSGNLIFLMKNKKQSLLSLQGKNVSAAEVFRHLIDPDEKLPVIFGSNAYIPYRFLRKVSRELPEYLLQAKVGYPLATIIGQAFTPTEIDSTIKINSEIYRNFPHDMTSYHFPPKHFKINEKYLSIEDFSRSQIDEMVADNIAMRLLTDSLGSFKNEPLLPLLHHDFSTEQIFYLQIAQEFCPKNDVMDVLIESFENDVLPPPIRMANVFRSSEKFSEHFSCPEGYHLSERQFPYIEMTNLEGPLMTN